MIRSKSNNRHRTSNVNDPSGHVLAVYHGRQMKRSVFMYPVEYRAYGPDGINVVYERDNGVNAGQWVKRYLTTDYQGSVLQAHDASGDHEQHYELFGAEKEQVARRTGWLDREIDWETSPLSDLYRTVDLVNRKYDPQRTTFLTSDPLWMMSADASSYHYGYHDPMNMIDPWGLDGQKDGGVAGPDKGGGGGGGVEPTGPSGPRGPRGTPTVIPFDFLYDILWSNGMHEIGGTSTPGGGNNGGGLGPVGGGNGANGKTDPASPPKQGQWAGVPYRSDVSKWSTKQVDGVRISHKEYHSILIRKTGDASKLGQPVATISTPNEPFIPRGIPLYSLFDDIWITGQRFVPWIDPGEISHLDNRYATDSERMESFINVGTSIFLGSRTLFQGKAGMIFPTKPMWFNQAPGTQYLPSNHWIRFGHTRLSGVPPALSLKLGAHPNYINDVPLMLRPVNETIRFHLNIFPWR